MISLTLAASLLKGAINLQLCAELTRVVVLVATLRGYNRLCKCFTEYCGQWVCMNCRGLIRFIGGKSVVVWSFCTQHIVLALFPASLPPCLPASLPPWLPASLPPVFCSLVFHQLFYGTWLHFRRTRVCVCSVQLFAKYRQGRATLNPFHQYQKIKEAASLRSSTCKSFLPQKFSFVQVSAIQHLALHTTHPIQQATSKA